MEFQQILNSLRGKKYDNVYFLTGEEPYYIDLLSNYIADNVLKEEEKAFNQLVLYGKDVDAATVSNFARQFPLMSEFRVVIVREAQNIKDIDQLVYYISKPLKSTILVLCYKYKKLDKRTKFSKELAKSSVFFESKKLYENKIPDWITFYLKDKGYSIQTPAALLLTEFLGNDLTKISMELDKLLISLSGEVKTITTDHIEKNIGISKDFNTVELQKALVEKNALKAFRIVDYFGHNQKNNPFILTITSLYYFFSKVFLYSMLKDKSSTSVTENLKIHPYFIKEYQRAASVYPPAKSALIMNYLREYDLKAKGVGNISATPHDLLKELIYKILN